MALRIDSSQNRNLYVGTGTEVAVSDGNAIVTGNVGIGTTSPSAPLEIYQGGSGKVTLLQLARPNTAGLQSNIQFTVADIMVGQIQHEYEASNLNHMSFTLRAVNGSDIIPLWLENSGNVGIGTTSPSWQLEVENTGTVRAAVNSTSNGSSGVFFRVFDSGTQVGNGTIATQNNGDMKFFTGTSGEGARIIIDSAGAIQFNNYDSTNQTGTPTYLLGTDASGNVVKTNTVPGSGAGPYLPLSAGSGFPLTGDLLLRGTYNPYTQANRGNITLNGSNSNIIAFTSNTVAKGYIYHNGTDLEMMNIATGVLKFSAGNTERMRITNGGNVGIGTTLPIGKFNVSKDSTTDGLSQAITVSSSSVSTKRMNLGYVPGSNYAFIDVINYAISNTNQALSLQPNGGNVGIGVTGPVQKLEVYQAATNSQAYVTVQNNRSRNAAVLTQTTNGGFYTGTSIGTYTLCWQVYDASAGERMRITSAGELQVTGNGVIRNEHSSANFSYWQQTASDARLFTQYAQPLYFGTNASTKMTILSGGNVGIGVTAPIVPLHVSGTAVNNPSNGTGGYEVMQIFDTTSYATGVGGGIGFGGNFTSNNNTIFSEIRGIKENATDNNYAGALSFSTRLNGGNITERMRISSAGNVGIGTSTPLAKLDIQGTQGQLFSVTDDLSGSIFAVSDISGVPIFDVNSSGLSYFDGEVSLKSRLNLQRSSAGATTLIQFKNEIGVDKAHIDFGGTNEELSFFAGDGTTENITINSGGNVGIGTTSPGQKLHLNETGVTSVFAQWSNNSLTKNSYLGLTSAGMFAMQTNDNIAFYTGASYTERIRITSAGTLLLRSGAFPTNQDAPFLYRIGGGSLAIGSATETGSSAHVALYTNSLERMRIDSSGNTTFTSTSPELTIKSNNGAVGSGTSIGKLSWYTSDATTPTGVGNVTTMETKSTTSNGSDYAFIINKREGSGGGSCYMNFGGNSDGSISFGTNTSGAGTERMRINSSGNVGIGVTNPGSKLQVAGEIRVADGTKAAPSYSFTSDTNTGMYSDAADTIKLVVGGDDTLIINSSSNVGIGTSNPDVKFHVTTSEDGSGIDKGTAKFINTNTGQGATTMHMVQTSSSAYANAVKFWQGSTPTPVGFIRLTTSATQFITSASDLNLKKNITTWSDDTLSKFKALEPKKFRFKTQDTSEDKTLGFIAQNEVDNFPEAYPQFLGEDEKPYYGFNPSGMVPHLMKAIKDLVEKVETLENKITQLENNN